MAGRAFKETGLPVDYVSKVTNTEGAHSVSSGHIYIVSMMNGYTTDDYVDVTVAGAGAGTNIRIPTMTTVNFSVPFKCTSFSLPDTGSGSDGEVCIVYYEGE